MKQIILPCLILLATTINAQPKLIAPMTYNGPKDGGGIFRFDLPALTPGLNFTFDNSNPHRPNGGVTIGDEDWLYGLTGLGGTNNKGALYRIRMDGTEFEKLYDLVNPINTIPMPYYHTDGKIYFCDEGVFKTYNTNNGVIATLPAPFGPPTLRNLYIDADDWIYFAEYGFSPRLVKMKTDGSSWTQLHQFNSPAGGEFLKGGVTETGGDTLFGTLSMGGDFSAGLLFSIKKDGTGFFVHHQFTPATGGGPDSRLVYFDGKLYGTTNFGGTGDKGVLFCINNDGSNYRVIRHFGIDPSFNTAPVGNIAISTNGRIFGAFVTFAPVNQTRLFKVDTSGDGFDYFFTGNFTNVQRSNGDLNQDVLLIEDEDIYFPTYEYGKYEGGVLNHTDTSGNGTDLYHYGFSSTGFRPLGGFIKGSDGKLYGTASIGGVQGNGVIFSINADGTGYTKLHELTDAEGYTPSGKLLEASDGRLYGATRWGGPNFSGSIFRLNKNGTGFQVIYNFPDPGTTGYSPVGSFIEDVSTGVLYGVNFYPNGSIFRINKDGSNFTVIKTFNAGADFAFPYNGVKSYNGYLYGTAGYGGVENKGGVYRIRPNGTDYQLLYQFSGANSGETPVAAPTIASNGKLYGSTASGGSDFAGVLFSMNTDGTGFTLIRDMNAFNDGGYPWGSMIQASDGLLYGPTQTSGPNGGGTIFRINLDGSNFTLIKSFDLNTEGQGFLSLLDLNGDFTVLPLTFLSFTAQKRNQTSVLNWKTAQERNTALFEIERSADGVAFYNIGNVPAAGTAAGISTYTFTDQHPINGINYYRLKQLDQNHAYEYSKVVTVKFGDQWQVIVSPNPASDKINLRLPAGNQYTGIHIYDAVGKLVLQKQINNGSTVQQLDIHQLPAGWYVLKLNGDDNFQQSFIKK